MSYGKGRACVLAAFVVLAAGAGAVCRAAEAPQPKKKSLVSMLDAPMLFVKRQSYTGIHIYDTYFKWRPGGGIYVLENPGAPPEKRKFRAVIAPGTPETLGQGIYSEPDISWDAKRILFCFKGKSNGHTSIYEIGIDGKGLRRLTDPSSCRKTAGRFGTHHDVGPAYLPDGRIIFTSTRPSSLVPCNNTAVDILHVMNADGTGIRPISVNNVNEFDPCVLPDGRILHGRWEYVDKTALTQQSIWTIFPDGTNETALFANNLVHPEAVLDARPVPGAPHLVAATFTPHNSPPRGSIAIINPRIGRDTPAAITNFEHKNNPTHDRGNSCEPWPLSKDVILFSGRSRGLKRNAVEIMDRSGRREVVHADPKICCHSPMLIKPRQRPRIIAESTSRRPDQTTGRFYVQNIYDGLPGVKRGEVKQLRVIDETSRVSPRSTGSNPYNQTFLVSAALAFGAKIFLGVVPVEPDGSVYFEAPSGRTVYFQALDGEGRLIQSMRTFIQAAPGVTRSCIGCHENKFTAPANMKSLHRQALCRAPSRLKPESWGSGFVDYPGMVQPILDKHCVGCHGGRKGIAGKLDLSGGWTEYFNISYENLASRRKTQITADLIAAIDCMNGTSLWSAKIMPPRAHGSAVAPLAEVLVSGHKKRIEKLTRAERDLMMAWIDTNGLYHGTWNRSKHGHRIGGWANVRKALVGQMRAAGCVRCHGGLFEGDWINLKDPEFSRILRAPLPEGKEGFGLGWCRDRKVDPRGRRICMLVRGYAHGVMPLAKFARPKTPSPGTGGEPVVTFASTEDRHYQAMLKIIRDGRRQVLAAPRVDMPGAEITAGLCRYLIPPSLPESLPALKAHVDAEGAVRLSWERSAWTIGLSTEVHRGAKAGFVPDSKTLLATTRLFQYADSKAQQGPQHYALILVSTEARSTPIRATVTVPPPKPPAAPAGLKATATVGCVELRWQGADGSGIRYHVYRAKAGSSELKRLTAEGTAELRYSDATAPAGVKHSYTVRAVNKRGAESAASQAVMAAALAEIKDPLFVAALTQNSDAALHGGAKARGTARGKAKIVKEGLDLREGGYVTFAHRPQFDLTGKISVACRVKLIKKGQIPVIVSCGRYNEAGWFLQRIGNGWRWHVGGIDCDGGAPAPGKWTHLVGTFDGRTARLFQDGRLVAEKSGNANRTRWTGPLHVGQYSGGVGPEFQVTGWISNLRIYGRDVRLEDLRAANK